MPATTFAALGRTAFIGASFSIFLTFSQTASAAIGKLPYIPTRFHLCSVELASLEGEAREEEMQLCLRTRFRAEKIITSNCAKEVKHLRPAPRNADDRYQAKRQCFIAHLSNSYKDLLDAPVATAASNTDPAVARPKRTPTAAPHKGVSTSTAMSNAGAAGSVPSHPSPSASSSMAPAAPTAAPAQTTAPSPAQNPESAI